MKESFCGKGFGSLYPFHPFQPRHSVFLPLPNVCPSKYTKVSSLPGNYLCTYVYEETCSLSIVFGLLDVLAGERHLSEQFITAIIHKPSFAAFLEICCREIQCQMTFCKLSNILRDSSSHLSIKIVLLSWLVWKFKSEFTGTILVHNLQSKSVG